MPTNAVAESRDAVLHAITRLQDRTGGTEFARRDIVAEIQATGVGFERQTIYRCLRRLTGHEPGSPHLDLRDLGNDRLRPVRDPPTTERLAIRCVVAGPALLVQDRHRSTPNARRCGPRRRR